MRFCLPKPHATACGLKKLLSSEHPWFKRLLVPGDELQEVSRRCLPDSSSGMCMRRGWGQALLPRHEKQSEFFSRKQLCWNWPHRKQKPRHFQKDSGSSDSFRPSLLTLSHVSPLPSATTGGASPALYSSSPCSRSTWYPMSLPLLSCSKSWPSSHP